MSADQKILIEGLKALRKFVVEARRSTVALSLVSGTDQQGAVDHIIQCQKALRAIDEALDEEVNATSEISLDEIARENARARNTTNFED